MKNLIRLTCVSKLHNYWRIVAAKLGRRSRKMRETIAEACRTIEDNQTAQALHGLLSLKAENHDGVLTLTSPPMEISSSPPTVQQSNTGDTLGAGIMALSATASAQSVVTALSESSGAPVDTAQPATDASGQKTGVEMEQQLMKSLEKARICNSEVLNVS